MEFSEEQWHGLKKHAAERHLMFLSSPFSLEAVDLLDRVGVAAWKVASGEVSNGPMFERMAATGLPILLSTGMSPLDEIDATVARIQAKRLPVAVLQCTSMYPTPPEKIGLNLIPVFRQRYHCAVGLSDHSGAIYAGLAAAALGIEVLEVHMTLSREAFGPDVPASLTTAELAQLVEGIRAIETMRANPVDKDAMARDMAAMRDLFTKSVVARVDLPAGTRLKNEHLTVKKPGTGISANRLQELVGRRVQRLIKADELLQEEDFE
jgi:N-acetylneuraminate synthase